ncbi:MAG: hypothetical protein WBQ34_18580 [Candidatus Acidiferrales bacterium]
MSPIPDEIEAHYLQANEADRLKTPLGELEFLRTQSILERSLPPPPAVILDVGGAAGAHAATYTASANRHSQFAL